MPVADRQTLKESLRVYWQELLEIDHVPDDAFFIELGGNSLLATVIASRLEEEHRVQASLEDIFLHSLEELAAVCARHSGKDHQ